jgi:hypothetical protein
VVDRLVVAAAPGLGMLAYSAYVYDLTGDPFMWIRLAAWGRENIGVAAFLAGEWRSLGEQGLRLRHRRRAEFSERARGAARRREPVPVWRRFGARPRCCSR